MPEETIELTPQELKDLENTITFRVKTTETLKRVCRKMDKLNGVGDDVKSLKTHRAIQWGFISAIALAILTMPFWLVKTIMAVAR